MGDTGGPERKVNIIRKLKTVPRRGARAHHQGCATLGTVRNTNSEGPVRVPWAWESEGRPNLNNHIGGGGWGEGVILFPLQFDPKPHLGAGRIKAL